LAFLAGQHEEMIQWLFGRAFRAFVVRAINTLHYIQTRDPINLLTAARGRDLYFLIQQLSWLMKLCFLTELGFSSDEQKQIVTRNRRAQFIHTAAVQSLNAASIS